MIKGDSDLEEFIHHQKQKLQKEKELLSDYQKEDKERVVSKENRRFDESLRMPQDNNIFGGFNLGHYEDKQRQLKEERALEYKKFLAEKDFRSKGKISPLLSHATNANNNNQDNEKLFQPREVQLRKGLATPDLYEELLRRKRAEERRYRESYEDPEVNSNRRVQFDVEGNYQDRPREVSFHHEDDELFEWAKERSKKNRGQSAIEKRKEAASNDAMTRAKSVPPEPSGGIFGGTSNAEQKQKKQAEYKRQLEEQIRQKEEQKRIEKLKRMGKITSSTDLKKLEDKAPQTEDKESEEKKDDSPRKPKSKTTRGRWKDPYEDEPHERYQPQMPNHGYGGFDPYMAMMFGPYGGQRAPDRYHDPYMNYPPMARRYSGYAGDPYDPRGLPEGNVRHRSDRDDYDRRPSRERMGSRGQEREAQYSDEVNRDFDTSDGKSNNKSNKDKTPPGGYTSTNIFSQSDEVKVKQNTRSKQQAYQEELRKQIEEKEKAKKKDKAEKERYEAKIEAEILDYNPWGKGGGGAPIKNDQGHVVADLRTMHQYNQEGKALSPRGQTNNKEAEASLVQDIQSPMLAALEMANQSKFSPRLSLDGSFNKSSPFARGAALKELQGLNQGSEQKAHQDEYREYLRLQVEEKSRRKKEEQDKLKAEEEKESRRLEEQRKKIEQEYLQEQENQRKKEEELRKKNDELRKAAEEKRLEVERKKRAAEEERHQCLLRRSLERKSLEEALRSARGSQPLTTEPEQSTTRTSSPPVPALMKQQPPQGRASPPVPALQLQQIKGENVTVSKAPQETFKKEKQESERITHIYEYQPSQDIPPMRNPKTESHETENVDMNYLNSIRDNIFNTTSEGKSDMVEQQHVLTQLRVIRNQLLNEEKKLESNIEENKVKYRDLKARGALRKQSADGAEIFGRARIKKNSQIRKQDNRAADEFRKITDISSILDMRSNKNLSPDLDAKQREFIRQQEEKLVTLRELLEKSARNLHVESQKMNEMRESKTSLLDSDSKFIGVGYENGTAQSRPETGELQSSDYLRHKERENRRVKTPETPMPSTSQKPSTPGAISIQSSATLAIEEIAARNEERLRQLKLQKQQPQAENEPTAEAADAILSDYMNRKL